MAYVIDGKQHQNRNDNACYESVDDNVLFHLLFFVAANVAIAQPFPLILLAIFLLCSLFLYQSMRFLRDEV